MAVQQKQLLAFVASLALVGVWGCSAKVAPSVAHEWVIGITVADDLSPSSMLSVRWAEGREWLALDIDGDEHVLIEEVEIKKIKQGYVSADGDRVRYFVLVDQGEAFCAYYGWATHDGLERVADCDKSYDYKWSFVFSANNFDGNLLHFRAATPNLQVGMSDSVRYVATLDLNTGGVAFFDLIGDHAISAGDRLYRLDKVSTSEGLMTMLAVSEGEENSRHIREYGRVDPRGMVVQPLGEGAVVFVVIPRPGGRDDVEVLHVTGPDLQVEVVGSISFDRGFVRIDSAVCGSSVYLSGVVEGPGARSVVLAYENGEFDVRFIDDGHSAILTREGDGPLQIMTQLMVGREVTRRTHIVGCQ